MNELSARPALLRVFAMMTVAFVLLACGVGDLPFLGSAKEIPAANPTLPSGQPTQAPGKPTQAVASTVPAASSNPSSRVSDSFNRLVIMDEKTLPSYHMEVSATEPRLNSKTKKIETLTYAFKADVSGNDIHFIDTEKTDTTKTIESYIFDFGNDSGKKYSIDNGALKEDLFAELTWAMLPLNFGMPLIYAAMGPQSMGEEAVDGRASEKFSVDTARAPAGTLGTLKGLGLNVYSSKGTAWVDKASGALLKMVLDYEQDVTDPSNGGTSVGKASGHIELIVSQVGKVTVKLPDLPKGGAGVTPTVAPSATPTTKPAATTAPKGPTAKPSNTPTKK